MTGPRKPSRDPGKRHGASQVTSLVAAVVATASALASIIVELGARGTLSILAVLASVLGGTLAIRRILFDQSNDDDIERPSR